MINKTILGSLVLVAIIIITSCAQEQPVETSEEEIEKIEVAKGKIISSGTYTCPTCKTSHRWQINDKHLMFWDNKPYVPVAGFWSQRHVMPPQITDFNIWIDSDFKEIGLTESQYFQNLDEYTTSMTTQGKTYIPLIAYPPKPRKDAAWVFDPQEVSKVTQKWKEYAPFVSKEGLRAIVIYNEINTEEWNWGDIYTPDEYGKALGNLAQQAQAIFGEVPIFFKTLGTLGGYKNVFAGATYANGLGFDLFPETCSSTSYESFWQFQINTLKSSLATTKKPIGLLWIAELGKHSGKTDPNNYFAAFAPFSSKTEFKCYVDILLDIGFTGFIYAPNHPDIKQYKWYAELKPYIQQKIIEKTSTSNISTTSIAKPDISEPVEYQPYEEPSEEITESEYFICFESCLETGEGDEDCEAYCREQG